MPLAKGSTCTPIRPKIQKIQRREGPLDKDLVTRHSGTIGHSVARHSFYLALGPLGTGSHGHWGARFSVATSFWEVQGVV